MVKTLHILNGDASVPAFQAAALPGDVIVWREIMSEGPVVPQVKDEAFWEMRQQYILQHYGESAEAYKTKVLEVLQQLKHLHGFEELVLWFDTDLMCQINLLFLLYYIKPQHHQTLQMAIPEQVPVSQLSKTEFQETFEQRVSVKSDDQNLVQQLWQAYADESPLLLQELLNGDLSPFRHLQQALTLHFQRFPSCETGLNHFETLLLQHLENGISNKQSLMQAIWQDAPGYGYGASQIEQILQDLSPSLLQLAGEKIAITEAGRKVLQKQVHLSMLQAKETFVGGVKLDGKNIIWCRDTEESKVRAINKNPDSTSFP